MGACDCLGGIHLEQFTLIVDDYDRAIQFFVPLERPEVDRADLHNLLLASLPEHAVRWGQAFEHADDGLLHIADGDTATCDLLVGADGATLGSGHC